MAAHRRLHRRRDDLAGAFRNQLASLREETEAAEAEFQGLDARIKELEAQIEARIKEHETQIKERERFFRSSFWRSAPAFFSTAAAQKLGRDVTTRENCSRKM